MELVKITKGDLPNDVFLYHLFICPSFLSQEYIQEYVRMSGSLGIRNPFGLKVKRAPYGDVIDSWITSKGDDKSYVPLSVQKVL